MKRLSKPNPYDFFGIRRLDTPCIHFDYINIPLKYNLEQSLSKWIGENLKGRYYLGKNIALSTDGQVANTLKIGFEDHKELSYFTLACPLLKYN